MTTGVRRSAKLVESLKYILEGQSNPITKPTYLPKCKIFHKTVLQIFPGL